MLVSSLKTNRLALFFFTFSFVFLSHPFSHADQNEKKQIQANFARDILMPLGLPIVSSYHAMRENFFLNARVRGGRETLLESFGNFFLAPSQYLFDGKTVKINADGEISYQVQKSFHYRKLHWFKTLASIIALPVGEVIGSTLKGIAHLSPDVRRRNRAIRRSLKAPIIQSHLEDYRAQGLDPPNPTPSSPA